MKFRLHKKSKGSAMSLVLIVSMLLAITAGVISISVLSSNKALAGTVSNNNLFYSAESGLEYGRAKFFQNVTSILREIPTVGSSKTYDVLEAATGDVKEVKVTYRRKAQKQIEVLSIAIDNKNRKREILMTLEDKGESSNNFPKSKDIYSNSIVASENINVDITGSATLWTTNFLVGNEYVEKVKGSVNSPKLTKIKYDTPIFVDNFKKVDLVQTTSTTDHLASLKSKAKILSPNGGTSVENGIGYFTFKDGANNFDVFLINGNNINIDLGKYPLNNNKFLIISNGNITFNSKVNSTIMYLNWGTIFGKNISIVGEGSININSHIYSGDAYGLTDDGIKKLDEIISKYILNWNKQSNEGNGSNNSTDGWKIEGEILY